jgi:hypothetical protein
MIQTGILTEGTNPLLHLLAHRDSLRTTQHLSMPHVNQWDHQVPRVRPLRQPHKRVLSRTEHSRLLLQPMQLELPWARPPLLLLRMDELNQSIPCHKVEGGQAVDIPRINVYRNNHSNHLHPNMCLTILRPLQTSPATRVPHSPPRRTTNRSHHSRIPKRNHKSNRSNHLLSHKHNRHSSLSRCQRSQPLRWR